MAQFTHFASKVGRVASKIGGESSKIRDVASKIGDESSKIGDESSKVGDESSKVGDGVAKVRDVASKIGDESSKIRDVSSKVGDPSAKIFDGNFQIGGEREEASTLPSPCDKGTIPAACENFHKLARAMLNKIQGRYATAKAAAWRLKVEGSRKLKHHESKFESAAEFL